MMLRDMPTFRTPGVYVEEAPSQSRPIEGVETSVAAFVGIASGGPLNEPVECVSWAGFVRAFGEAASPDAYLAPAVYGFFLGGGTRCWVVRAARPLTAALDALAAVDDVPMLCVPDVTALGGDVAEVVAHCESRGDRMA